MPATVFAERAEDACAASMGHWSALGPICVRPKGHDGDHVCDYEVLHWLAAAWQARHHT